MKKNTTVVFYENYVDDVFTTLSTDEIDLYYFLLKNASQQIDDNSGIFQIAIESLPSSYERIIRKLRSMIMVVNHHDTATLLEKEDLNLISRIKYTSTIIQYFIEPEIMESFVNHKQNFDNTFVKIDWALKSKYSKFLYRILSEHRNTEYTIHYELLLMLLNLSNPKYLAGRSYSVFNREVLKKCVDELNSWSDLRVDYYPIKNKKNNKSADSIVFELKTQEPTLKNEELSEQEELDIVVSQMIEQRADEQFKKASKYANIMDKSAYINAIIKKIDRSDIESELRLKKWLKYAKEEFKPNTDQPALLCFDPKGKRDMITITNEYGLFHTIAVEIAKKYNARIKYIPFPEKLKGQYQKYTQANLSKLHSTLASQ